MLQNMLEDSFRTHSYNRLHLLDTEDFHNSLDLTEKLCRFTIKKDNNCQPHRDGIYIRIILNIS